MIEDGGYIPYIGNLCLLEKSANSRASNQTFMEKRKIYEEEDSLLHVQDISSFATERRKFWGTEAIDARADKLKEFITEHFSG